jgi:hypothetical protein
MIPAFIVGVLIGVIIGWANHRLAPRINDRTACD